MMSDYIIKSKLWVHRNGFFKFRPEPDLPELAIEIRPEPELCLILVQAFNFHPYAGYTINNINKDENVHTYL